MPCDGPRNCNSGSPAKFAPNDRVSGGSRIPYLDSLLRWLPEPVPPTSFHLDPPVVRCFSRLFAQDENKFSPSRVTPREPIAMSYGFQDLKARSAYPLGTKTLHSVWNECRRHVTRAIGGPLLWFVFHLLFRIACPNISKVGIPKAWQGHSFSRYHCYAPIQPDYVFC